MSSATSARWGPWIWGLLAAVAASAIHWALRTGELMGGMYDEALLIPIGLNTVDPSVLAADDWVVLAADVFSVPYSYVVGHLVGQFGDPMVALRVLAFPFLVVFLAGVMVLARRKGGAAGGGRLALGILILPLLLLEPSVTAALEPLLPPIRDRLSALALAPGAALPRDLVFAFFPLAWAVGWTCWDRGVAWVALPCLALGLLANVHPLTGLHAAGLLLLTGLVSGGVKGGPARFVIGVVAFLVGAAPFVLQYLDFPVAAGAAPDAVRAWRIDGIGGESLVHWMARMEPLLWLWAGALVLLRGVAGERSIVETRLLRGAAWATLIAAVGPFLAGFAEPLAGFQPDRLSRFAVLLLVVLIGRLAVYIGRQGNRFVPALALAVVAVIVVAPPILRPFVGGNGTAAPFEVAAKILRRLSGQQRSTTPPGLLERTTPGDPARPKQEGAGAQFLEVCDFVRANTEAADRFLVPPEDWGAFRTYARRPAVVTRKEGGFALSFLGGKGAEWFELYSGAVRVFAEGDAEAWAELATRTNAAYVVADPGSEPPETWPVVFRTALYSVHAVSR